MTTVIGYTYNAGCHCVGCATDTYRDPDHASDAYGNKVHPMFSTDEYAATCDDCGGTIVDVDTATATEQRMTYGVLPTEEAFMAACVEPYAIRNCKRVGTDTFTPAELWDEVCEATTEFEDGDDDAGQWASDILYSLGFEWV